jgi:hypothetical protein
MTRKLKRELEIIVNLELDTADKAKVVEASLRPDNRDLPSGLSMEQTVNRRTLRIIFNSRKNGVETLLSTLDEVLAAADTSVNTLKEV